MSGILNITQNLQKKYDDITKLKKGKINIGLTSSKANSALPAILPVFKKNYPDIELTLTEASSSNLESLLKHGNVDVCMMNLPIKSKGIEYEPILTEDIFLAAPPQFVPKHTRHTKTMPKINIKDLDDEPFILLHTDQRLRQISDSLFMQAGVKPRIVLETRSIETALSLCNAGLGLCFVPEFSMRFTALAKPPKFYSIGDADFSWTLVIAYKQGAYRTKAVQAFAAIAKEVITK